MASEQASTPIPNNALYAVAPRFPVQTLTDDGAITLTSGGIVELNKAGAIAATLALPAQNGCVLMITSKTAQAHTVTVASGLHGLGAGEDVGTFGGAVDDCVVLASIGGYWVQVANVNVTFA